MSLLNARSQTTAPALRPRDHARWESGGRLSRLLQRLGPTELHRRCCHIGPGFLPFLLWPIPHYHPFSPLLQSTVVLVALAICASVFVRFPVLLRPKEVNRRGQACSGYTASIVALLLLFPLHPELGLTVLAINAFGDGFANLAGILIGGRALPWNSRKTVAGTMAFVLGAIPMATLVYWGEGTVPRLDLVAHPVTWTSALLIASMATLPAALAESVRSRIDDNVRVGLTAAVTIVLAQTLIVGWA